MNDPQKFTISYGRDPSIDLPEADAAAEFAQYLEDLRKVDPSIPPMPETVNFLPVPGSDSQLMVDPLCPRARWWCEHFRLSLLAEDFNGGDKHAFWKALTLIAEHQLPPPAWLAAAMLKEFSEKATTKSEDGRGERTTPERAEAAQQEFEAIKAAKLQGLADGMVEVQRLREKGLHRKAETLKHQTQDRFRPTVEEIALDMGISRAHLNRLREIVARRASQREALTDRLA
jgi:hypothetical protein